MQTDRYFETPNLGLDLQYICFYLVVVYLLLFSVGVVGVGVGVGGVGVGVVGVGVEIQMSAIPCVLQSA